MNGIYFQIIKKLPVTYSAARRKFFDVSIYLFVTFFVAYPLKIVNIIEKGNIPPVVFGVIIVKCRFYSPKS
jgi:hypothetical protein